MPVSLLAPQLPRIHARKRPNKGQLIHRLLHFLMSRSGCIFSAEDIIQAIWGGYGSGDEVLLTNVVYRLRRKIEDDPSQPALLQTWQGGYSFQG